MVDIDRVVDAGRQFVQRRPGVTDDELRGYLYREFLVERDIEVSLLRSVLWPVAMIVRLFRRSTKTRAEQFRDVAEEAIRKIRAFTPRP